MPKWNPILGGGQDLGASFPRLEATPFSPIALSWSLLRHCGHFVCMCPGLLVPIAQGGEGARSGMEPSLGPGFPGGWEAPLRSCLAL